MRRPFAAAIASLLFIVVSASAATVDGIEVHWTSSGAGAQTVIFVHGWTCDETSWREQVAAIGKSYRVITLDLPGHGKSGSSRDGKLSMELFARAVEAVRVEAKADKAILVGHSMGTPVIRQYALMYSQRVTGLVLVDGLVQLAGAAPGFIPPPMTGPEGLRVRETMVRSWFSASTSPELQKHILQMTMGARETTANAAMQATWNQPNLKNDAISAPTLGIYADKSALANRDGMKRLYPNLEYHEIPGTGHFLMLEKPQEFNRLLLDFLGKLKA